MRIIFLFFILIIKLNAQVPYLDWARQCGGINNDYGNSITVDVFGNVITTGSFQGTVDFDPSSLIYNLTSSGNEDTFIAKSDSVGNFLWAKKIGGNNQDRGYSLIADSIGNIYVTGFFSDVVDFDPNLGVFNISSLGQDDVFILKLNSFGNFIWAKGIGGNLMDQGSSVTIDKMGKILVTGIFSSNVDFDTSISSSLLYSNGALDGFILKMDSLGNFLWAKNIGGISNDIIYEVTSDLLGNVFIIGFFNGTSDFDPSIGVSNLTSSGSSDVFVSKLDILGNLIWVRQFGGTSYEYGRSIKVDKMGSVYITGQFSGIADFDPSLGTHNLTSNGDEDIFVEKLDAIGHLIWVKQVGGNLSDYGLSLDLDNYGNVFVTGYFSGVVDFDASFNTYYLTSAGLGDIFILKLDFSGNFSWSRKFGSNLDDYCNSIFIDINGNIYTTGFYNGVVDFDPNFPIVNLTSFGLTDVFINKFSKCNPPSSPINITNILNQNICSLNTTTLTVNGSGVISWFSSLTSSISLGTGVNFVTPILSIGNYTYYAEAYTCSQSVNRAALTLTVNACIGLEDYNLEKCFINIFPNPVGVTSLNVFSKCILNKIEIYNSLGQIMNIEVTNLDENLFKINLINFTSGIYFIKLKNNDNEIYYQKIISN